MSFLEARNRHQSGHSSLGAKGFLEDAMRARGMLPTRHPQSKIEEAKAHFSKTKSRLSHLEEENVNLREQLEKLEALADSATKTLSSQREHIASFYSKSQVADVDDANCGDSSSGGCRRDVG